MKGENFVDHLDGLMKQEWERQNPLFQKIRETGVREYFENLPNLDKAFQLRDHSLRCIDEGTPGGIHMAGSGILSETGALELAKQAKIDGVYSHEGCGAAALYAKQAGLDVSKSDEIGIEWSKKLAELAGVSYKGHLVFSQMSRPGDYHTARVVYFDGSGNFDPTAIDGVPNGFVISRRFLESFYALQELQVAINIAFGHHGLGNNFTSEDPLWVVTVGDNALSEVNLESLTKEIDGIVRTHNGRVASFGFNTPR